MHRESGWKEVPYLDFILSSGETAALGHQPHAAPGHKREKDMNSLSLSLSLSP